MRNCLYVLLALVLASCFISCDPAAHSASQAFDNANGVLKDGSNKLFMDPVPTEVPPTPLPHYTH